MSERNGNHELRRLVHIVDQRRARYCALPVPSVTLINDDDPCVEEMLSHLDAARVALLEATTELVDHLIDVLGMRSELRSE